MRTIFKRIFAVIGVAIFLFIFVSGVLLFKDQKATEAFNECLKYPESGVLEECSREYVEELWLLTYIPSWWELSIDAKVRNVEQFLLIDGVELRHRTNAYQLDQICPEDSDCYYSYAIVRTYFEGTPCIEVIYYGSGYTTPNQLEYDYTPFGEITLHNEVLRQNEALFLSAAHEFNEPLVLRVLGVNE